MRAPHTTLTLANDAAGDLSDFALLLPVPSTLDIGSITTVDPEILDRLDAYSAPRMVEYSCEDLYGELDLQASLGGCALTSATDDGTDVAPDAHTRSGGAPVGCVRVEASFAVGEYDITVLESDDAGALTSWLFDHGYVMPPGAAPLIEEQIEAGSWFITARLNLQVSDRTWLSPLQLSYDADQISLPVRLGAMSSPGWQDLVVYVINDFDGGRAGVGSWPEVDLESECMTDSATFSAVYEERLDEAFAGAGSAFTTEYAWGARRMRPLRWRPTQHGRPRSARLRRRWKDGHQRLPHATARPVQGRARADRLRHLPVWPRRTHPEPVHPLRTPARGRLPHLRRGASRATRSTGAGSPTPGSTGASAIVSRSGTRIPAARTARYSPPAEPDPHVAVWRPPPGSLR